MRKKAVLFAVAFMLFAGLAYAVSAGNFAWNAVNDARVTGYKLGWGTVSGTYSTVVDAKTATAQILSNLPDDKAVYVAVKAYSATDESVWSPELIVYTLKAVAPTNGTITPAGNNLVQKGGSMTFTITPTDGYNVTDVKVDGVSVGKVTTYTFASASGCHQIAATFDKPIAPPDGLRLMSTITSALSMLLGG